MSGGSHAASTTRDGTARADAGAVRLTARDIAGLMLCGDMHGAPYDLLGSYLDVRPDRLRGITARWRAAGYAGTGRLGPGPAWCWLTRPGLAVTGLRFTPARPALGRLAHIRAVLAARLALEASDAGRSGQPWWRSERRIRAAIGGRVATGHIPDAEVSWPEIPASPYPGECWAIEAELTPKPLARTVTIMAGLLERRSGYSRQFRLCLCPYSDTNVMITKPRARHAGLVGSDEDYVAGGRGRRRHSADLGATRRSRPADRSRPGRGPVPA
ncbi:MAG TPA: hypothetical protein VMV92_26065 [Streptosporangiaceae bacterium]|nr:hypothetical protein [Streptosporangiaceae bacterium]